jgi:hypothetical protein
MSDKSIACSYGVTPLTSLKDDGIVVREARLRVAEVYVPSPNLGLRLRDKLGPDASQELSKAFEEVENDMLTLAAERFDRRLAAVECNLRQDMARMQTGLRVAIAEGLATIRKDMNETRADVIRWSFMFWIGQLAATAALLGLMLRLAGR